jgi:hypothetical protein
MDGRCTCGAVKFRMTESPLFIHACHCTWCQRETGSAFVMNAMIEMAFVQVTQGAPVEVNTPSDSGNGQIILRCPTCHVALWSHYSGAGRKVAFVRVGTLEDLARYPPDIHIFTSTKQPWLKLEGGAPVVPEYYEREKYWPAASLKRREKMLAQG